MGADTSHEASDVIDPLNKGLGAMPGPLASKQVPAFGWNLLREELSLPVAVLSEERMTHNLRWMQDFVTRYGVKLAPHGKTTMAPQLFRRQLAGGAWGITLATAPQVQAAYANGVRRVLMANQLVGRRNMAIIAELLRDPSEYTRLASGYRARIAAPTCVGLRDSVRCLA